MKQEIIDLFEKDDYLVSFDFDLDFLEATPSVGGHLVVLGMKVVEEEREARLVTLTDEAFAKYQNSTTPTFQNSIPSSEEKRLKVFKCDFWRRSFLALWKLPEDQSRFEEAFAIPFDNWTFSDEDAGVRTILPTEYVYGESSNGQGIEYVVKDDNGNSVEINEEFLEEEYDEDDDEIISYKFAAYDGSKPFRLLIVSSLNGELVKSEIHDEDKQEFEGSTPELMSYLLKSVQQFVKSA